MNYQNIFKHIHNKGFRGIYGMEHGKVGGGKEGEIALINAYRKADNFTVGS
jgi:hydroxypyruvate isomerase